MRINNIEKLLSGTENFFSDKQEFLFDELARPAAEKNPTSKLDIGYIIEFFIMKAFEYPQKAAQETQAHRCGFRRKADERERRGRKILYVCK